jgi:shikimate dehydrogenase
MRNTFKLGLIGYPLGHSLSPKIHTAALKACDLKGDYLLFPVAPDDLQELMNLLNRLRSGKTHGFNITIPHKQTIIPFLDELTLTAQAIGAVNTVYIKNGKLTGDNTDAAGFLADLQKLLTLNPQKPGNVKSALVLGAGGSARAVAYALVNDGWAVTVAARRVEQAQTLIAQFLNLGSRLTSIEYHATALDSIIPTLSLLVNTTPVGMYPNIDASPWPAELPFPSNATVYDLVYNPHLTKLVTDARYAGLPATTGLGMLIEQAVLAFKIWTGCKPSCEDLTAAIS